MAETIEASDIESGPVFKVTFGYEDYYLDTEAAQVLRDSLNDFLR